MSDLTKLTIKEASQLLAARKISSLELTKEFLKLIKKKNDSVNAFLYIAEETALRQAEMADGKRSVHQEVSPLLGIPLAIKDNILVKDLPCTAGSKILEDYRAPYDATVVRKIKEAGAVIIGKTNMDEFAMGSSTENSAFGPVKNPRDLERVPGGSSGGSAAAVAADECLGALGSDTGGSIRQPAAFCGVAGFKPTYGRVSRYGLIALASSLDQIGPLTKTVADARIIFETIAGYDENDATTLKNWPLNPFVEMKNLKVGVPNEYFAEGLAPEIEAAVRRKILDLEKSGAKIRGVDLPSTPYALACYYIIMPAEASSNLARYDGIKYGASAVKELSLAALGDLSAVYSETRGGKFGAEVKRRIILGTFVLSAGYYEAYYQKAQKVRSLIKRDFEKVFREVDVLLAPTTPTLPFKLGEKETDPLQMYLSDVYTVPANLAGLPALSLPIDGEVNGLPIGLQIIGRPNEDELVLTVGEQLEAIKD